jgi:8-hydroxy-5-deazaflavin:NADPH oxidoreductase
VVKSRTGGPSAKSFNANYAVLYDRLGEARERPCNLWCGDEGAREVVERLNRDAGYEPVYAGPLENAAAQKVFMTLVFAIEQGGLARSFTGWRLRTGSEPPVTLIARAGTLSWRAP